MEKELDNILGHFPEYRAKIISLFSASEDFKTLCADYLQCKIALEKSRDIIKNDVQVENEYEQLCIELEQDALRLLNGIHNSF